LHAVQVFTELHAIADQALRREVHFVLDAERGRGLIRQPVVDDDRLLRVEHNAPIRGSARSHVQRLK
jgi:hypothetical protein